MKKWFGTVLICLFLLNSAVAQDPCQWPGSKKDQRYFEELVAGNNDDEKLDGLLDKAVDFPESGKLWFELGKIQFIQEETKETFNYNQAKKSLLKAQELCPTINPLLNYYLGIIYYSKQDYDKSLEEFKAFISFEKNPTDKLHQQKLQDVRLSIPAIEKEKKSRNAMVEIEKHDPPKLLTKVSTDKSEYLPMLSPDNSMLLFTRKFNQAQRGMAELKEVEEFTLAKRIDTAFVFDSGTKMDDPFNRGGNYGGATLLLNNKEMYLTVCIPLESGYKNCDIYFTKVEKYLRDTANRVFDLRWKSLEKLGPNINAPDYWDAQPSVSPDGQTLFYTRYGEGTQETDIYYSTKDSTGNWQKAQPLASINTAGHDKAPFLHADGKTLYFASSGRGGVGGFDIYKSTFTANSCSEPMNIGAPINTLNDEHGMLVSTDGKYAVFASNSASKGTGNYDIFYMELPKPVRPEEIVLIKGVLDSASADTKLQLKDLDGNVIRDLKIDAVDGAYATIISKAEVTKPLVLEVDQDGAAFEARIINDANAKNGVIDNNTMQVSALKSNQPYTISDINFKTNSADVWPDSKLILNEFAKFLLKQPTLKVEIRGHTDNVGDKIKNQDLSIERALSVKKYLIERGVPESRLKHRGFGDNNPIDTNTTEKGKAKNRRTEFFVL